MVHKCYSIIWLSVFRSHSKFRQKVHVSNGLWQNCVLFTTRTLDFFVRFSIGILKPDHSTTSQFTTNRKSEYARISDPYSIWIPTVLACLKSEKYRSLSPALTTQGTASTTPGWGEAIGGYKTKQSWHLLSQYFSTFFTPRNPFSPASEASRWVASLNERKICTSLVVKNLPLSLCLSPTLNPNYLRSNRTKWGEIFCLCLNPLWVVLKSYSVGSVFELDRFAASRTLKLNKLLVYQIIVHSWQSVLLGLL